jgi:citrate lyase beta subunit
MDAHAAREATPQAAGAFLFEGKMVDAPVLEKARRTVRLAGAA